jgi:hypothetical protein
VLVYSLLLRGFEKERTKGHVVQCRGETGWGIDKPRRDIAAWG